MKATTQTHQPPLMSVREVAALLGVHRRTVWTWSGSGKMPAPVRVGAKVVRWRRRDVEKWLGLEG